MIGSTDAINRGEEKLKNTSSCCRFFLQLLLLLLLFCFFFLPGLTFNKYYSRFSQCDETSNKAAMTDGMMDGKTYVVKPSREVSFYN